MTKLIGGAWYVSCCVSAVFQPHHEISLILIVREFKLSQTRNTRYHRLLSNRFSLARLPAELWTNRRAGCRDRTKPKRSWWEEEEDKGSVWCNEEKSDDGDAIAMGNDSDKGSRSDFDSNEYGAGSSMDYEHEKCYEHGGYRQGLRRGDGRSVDEPPSLTTNVSKGNASFLIKCSRR